MGKDLKIKDYKNIYKKSYDFIHSIRSNRIAYMQDLEHTTAQTDSEKAHKELCRKLTIAELNLLDNILTEMDEIEYREDKQGEKRECTL